MSNLRPSELVPLLLELTEQYAKEIRPIVISLAKAGGGQEILGAVRDRPTEEDVHVEVDRICEERFAKWCSSFESKELRVRIISEHHPEGYGAKNPNVICYLDPFDGTDQYVRGIWEAWYSVFSFTTPAKQALAGGCLDFIAGILYTANVPQKRVVRRFLDTGEELEVSSLREVELTGKSVVASYKGKWKYLGPWFRMVEDYFDQERLAGITHYSWGGSFVYALLTSGVLSAYIMTREPTDEIRPGWAFVAAADLCLCSATEAGILRMFQWSQKSRVTFFIATPNRILAQAIAKGIWGKEGERGRGRLGNILSRPRIRSIERINGS